MSVLANHRSIKEKISAINFPLIVSLKLKEKETNAQKISSNIGRSNAYLHKQINSTDYSISLLLLLSIHLQTNFLEPFQNLLPENMRPTTQEKQLQQQITALQKELEDVKKERDLLKGILMK